MATAADQLGRLLALLPWLMARPGVSKADAAAAFGISVAQLDRDLRLAFTCELPGQPEVFIDIDYLDSDRVTVLDPAGLDRPLRLRAEEAVALAVGLRTLAALPGLADRDAVDSLLAKLDDAAAGVGTGVTSGAAPVVTAGPATGAAAVTERLTGALAQGRRVHLAYWVPSRDERTERDVDPWRLVVVDGVGYLEGYCHASEAVRTFRVDRVLDVAVLDATASPAPAAATAPLAGAAYRPAPGDTRAVLRLAPSARWVPDYYPCEEVVAAPDGSATVTLASHEPAFLVRLVLSLGGAVTVLEPVELADAVAERARAALARYGVS